MTRTYQVIVRQAWMHGWGYGIENTAIGTPKPTAAEAIRHGFRVIGCDDFNIGILRDGRLVDVRWMDKSIGCTVDELAKIAAEIGAQS